MSATPLSRRGLAAAALAFIWWGGLPVYLHLLAAVPGTQVVAHRIVWSCAFLLAWMLARGELWRLTAVLARPQHLGRLAASALCISVNWLLYVWSVAHQHIVDGSLGYYINPLLNVALGVLVLRERLNRVQWAAVVLAAAGVAYLTVLAGHPPWIALTLAFSFSLYGLLRKTVGVEALPGLATETLLLAPLALAYLAWSAYAGDGAFGRDGPAISALLAGCGLVTAVPLLLFAFGARALPYSTVGILQYIAPSLQLVCGVMLYGERFTPAIATGFGMIWAALLVYAVEGVWRARAAQPAGGAGERTLRSARRS